MNRHISIGQQDFARIRGNDYFYIDKTKLIQEWWCQNEKVTWISRPHQFSKTLSLTMLRQFFSGKRNLFYSLDIWSNDEFCSLPAYPVIMISFGPIFDNNSVNFRKHVKNQVLQSFWEYCNCETCILSSDKKDLFKQAVENYYPFTNLIDSELSQAVLDLCKILQELSGSDVIVLLDDTDRLFKSSCDNGYYEEVREFLRNLLLPILYQNPYIIKAMVMCNFDISNIDWIENVKCYDLSDTLYSTCLGFTEEEVYAAFKEFGCDWDKDWIRKMYGYKISGSQRYIYNPGAIIKYLRTGEFDLP